MKRGGQTLVTFNAAPKGNFLFTIYWVLMMMSTMIYYYYYYYYYYCLTFFSSTPINSFALPDLKHCSGCCTPVVPCSLLSSFGDFISSAHSHTAVWPSHRRKLINGNGLTHGACSLTRTRDTTRISLPLKIREIVDNSGMTAPWPTWKAPTLTYVGTFNELESGLGNFFKILPQVTRWLIKQSNI